MATWLDVSGDLNAAANWSGGTVPTSGVVQWLQGAKEITTNPTALYTGAQTFSDIGVGQAFSGQLGDPSNPIKLDAISGLVRINAPLAEQINFNCARGTVAKFIVEDCGGDTYSCHLYDGTITSFQVNGGGSILVGALANITTLEATGGAGTHPNPRIVIQYGAAVTNLYVLRGAVYDYAGATNVYVGPNGKYFREGGDSDNTLNSTLIQNWGGYAELNSLGTHTLITGHGGVTRLDGNTKAKTVTNCTAYAGAAILGGNGNVTYTNAPVFRGGVITGATAWVADSVLSSFTFVGG